MKKLCVFSILLFVSCSVLAQGVDRYTSCASTFFHKNLEYRLKKPELAKEFEGWRIAEGKTMDQLFEEELDYSIDLKNTYRYFRVSILKMYVQGLKTGNLQYTGCVECIRCNVGVILDMFRKSLIEHGQQVENDATAQVELEVDNPAGIIIEVPEYIKEKFEVPEFDPVETQPTYEEIEAQVEEEVTFHEKLLDAIRKVPTNATAKIKVISLARTLIGLGARDRASLDDLEDLNTDLQRYLDTKIIKEKQYPQNYNWWERTLKKSPFQWARKYGNKIITKQRVAREDKQFVEVALNIKALIAGELMKMYRTRKKVHKMKQAFAQRKEALRLALNIY